MKRLLTILIAILGLTVSAKSPKIEFQEVEHDFGNIHAKSGMVSCEFTYTNTGDAPLALISVSAPCGCTKPRFSPKPLAPGKSEKIKVTFNPSGMKGEFMKTITVRTNIKEGNKKKNVALKICGVVIPSK